MSINCQEHSNKYLRTQTLYKKEDSNVFQGLLNLQKFPQRCYHLSGLHFANSNWYEIKEFNH